VRVRRNGGLEPGDCGDDAPGYGLRGSSKPSRGDGGSLDSGQQEVAIETEPAGVSFCHRKLGRGR
jgi:hypothetical protein